MTNQTPVRPQPVIERDKWGRPLVIPPGGGPKTPYRRCTTYIAVLDDKHALETWKQRQIIEGLTKRPDLILKAAAAAGDPTTLNEVAVEAATAAGADAAATTGTALHALTEQIDRGHTPTIPDIIKDDISAYQHATRNLKIEHIEVFVVNDNLRVGGTFDRVVRIRDESFVADIKTGKNIEQNQRAIAMQLALYAHSLIYDIPTGARQPLNVNQKWGLVIHLPAGAGTCDLTWADLETGWEGVQLAKRVWEWRARKNLLREPRQ